MSEKNDVVINPTLLEWAIDRAGMHVSVLNKKFSKLEEWIKGEHHPTLKQLEAFAKTVHVPIGFLFLPEPPRELLPIPDFRTLKDREINRLSPDLLDMIYVCQQRQDWYRDYVKVYSLGPVNFIGSATIKNDPFEVAETIRNTLKVSPEDRRKMKTWEEYLGFLITRSENAGILVMSSSIVGNNTHRKLSATEFRGFALADDYAPLIFINAADSKSAQMFTLVHEIAHLWLGESGVVDTEAGRVPDKQNELWCNKVAAEFLMPIIETREKFQDNVPFDSEIDRLTKIFKVSSLVVIRRLYDAGFLNESELWQYYHDKLKEIRLYNNGSGGGDFYRTLYSRTGKLFAQAVLSSTLEGYTLFQDAFRMLGVKKTETFYEAARELGVMA